VCSSLASLTDLQELSPPVWCSSRAGSRELCESAYVTWHSGGAPATTHLCVYDSAAAKCNSGEGVSCTPPSLYPPPPPSSATSPSPPPPAGGDIFIPDGGVKILDGGSGEMLACAMPGDEGLDVVGNEAVAAQCCTLASPPQCVRWLGTNDDAGCLSGKPPAAHTYEAAVRLCDALNLVLCTADALPDVQCAGTGCQYNKWPVWSAVPCSDSAVSPPPPPPPPPSSSTPPPPPEASPPPPQPLCFVDAPAGDDWCGFNHPGQAEYSQEEGDAWVKAFNENGNWLRSGTHGWRFCGFTRSDCEKACVAMGDCAELSVTKNGCCFPARSRCDGDSRQADSKLFSEVCPDSLPKAPPL